MTENSTIIVHGKKEAERHFKWNSEDQGEILSAFFYGYIVTQIPGGWLAARFGGKYVMLASVLGTSVLTLLSPLAADLGKVYLMIDRILEGIFQGIAYPSMHAILGNWAPKMEKTMMASIVYSGGYFGNVIGMPLSAYLGHLGWPVIFYSFGVAGILWCIFWVLFFTDRPEDMRGISSEELALFKHENAEKGKHMSTPWFKILGSKEIWGIMIAHTCQNWGFYTMMTELPTILQYLLGYDHDTASSFAALPYLATAVVLAIIGPLVDYLRSNFKWWTTTRARKVFCCIGFIAEGAFLMIASIDMYTWLRLIAMIISVGFGGLAFLSFNSNMLDVAPQNAGDIMGISNTIATVAGIVEPLFVGAVVTEQLSWQWRIDFFTTAGIYFVGCTAFGILATGEVLDWAKKVDTTQMSS